MKIDVRRPEGNAWAIMGHVDKMLAAQGRTKEEIAAVDADMMSGDYAHLLEVANRETYDSFEWIGLDEDPA